MQIKEVTITRVFTGMKQTKYGEKPNVAIKTVEYGDKWLSTFKVNKAVMDKWGEGTKVALDIEEKNGFINFQLPDGNANLEARVSKLEKAVFGETSEPTVEVGETLEVTPKGLDDFEF